MTEIEVINDKIKVHGANPRGEQLFRLVWSNDQREWRHGTFNDFYGSIHLREVTETRLTPKYNYIRDRWILERWCPPELVYNRELPHSNQGSYEPIYVFESSKGQYLEPNLKVCEIVIHAAENPIHETVEEKINRQKEKEEKEIQYMADALELRSDIGFALMDRTALGYNKGYSPVSNEPTLTEELRDKSEDN